MRRSAGLGQIGNRLCRIGAVASRAWTDGASADTSAPSISRWVAPGEQAVIISIAAPAIGLGKIHLSDQPAAVLHKSMPWERRGYRRLYRAYGTVAKISAVSISMNIPGADGRLKYILTLAIRKTACKTPCGAMIAADPPRHPAGLWQWLLPW